MKQLAVVMPDKTHRDLMQSQPWATAAFSGGAFLWGYIWGFNTLFKRLGADKDLQEMTQEGLANDYNALADPEVRKFIRVRRNTTGFSIFMPAKVNFPTLFSSFGMEFYRTEPQQIEEKIEGVLPGFWDLANPLDMRIDGLMRGFPGDLSEEIIDPEVADAVVKSIRGFRLTSSPAMDRFRKTTGEDNRWIGWDGRVYDRDDVYRNALTAAWDARTSGMVMFAELTIPEKAAEFITQQRGANIRMSQLAEFFGRLHGGIFTLGRGSHAEFVPHVIAVSTIAKDNATSNTITIPNINEYGIAVDRSGMLTWVPRTSPDPSIVEDTIEVGGEQQDGDWTAQDTVDPAANEYTQEVGPNNIPVRRRKNRGQNMLMYVDWNLGKIAYTNDAARVRIDDISMYRPATAYHILPYLRTNLEERVPVGNAIRNSLSFVFRIAEKHGVKFPTGQQYNDPYTTPDSRRRYESNFAAKQLSFTGPMLDIQRVVSARRDASGRELTAEQYATLNAWLKENEDATLNLISPTSPSGYFRALHEYYRLVLESLIDDPDRAFGELSVPNTLDMIGVLAVIVHYAGKRGEVEAQDQEDRRPYIDPPLDPVDQVMVTDVPFVSGSVELMPHQVKAWNYMKNMPYNLILSVAAGGGKTLLALLYCAFLIGKGKVKRPLIACPGNLVANYFNDAGWLFKGRMNIVNISSSVIDSKNWGIDKLLALVKAAPVNTIFITDYDFVAPSSKSKRIVDFIYGNDEVRISLNTDLLRQVPWDLCIMDEAHVLKNRLGVRNREVTRLISNIKYKVQMSGTYISDSLVDVVGVYGMMDPQAFGTEADFAEKYMVAGPKSAPIPGAQKAIRDRMAETACVVNISRKEWAALLPKRQDVFYPVDLTPAQKIVYITILKETEEDLIKQYKTDPELRKALGGKDKDADAEEGEEQGDDDEDLDSMLDGVLGFYLARLEQFLTAPGADPLGKHLGGKDALSPKVIKTIELMRKHLTDRIRGKVMVWTQYVESAAAVYDALPADLKAMTVHYMASDSDQAMIEFEQNPKMKFMVGCEKSINTGHNLQFCSRIIRLETVWNFGTLEQGESRINRPAKDDPRKHENGGQGIFYDWVFANKTIDVVKNSRMFSKLISTVKFYESDNNAYMTIDEPPPIRLNRANLLSLNDWEDKDTGCRRFFMAYQQYQQVQEKEYTDFRNDPNNFSEPYTLEEGYIVKGSGLLVNVPYVPKMQIYGANKLGLVPYIEYVSNHKNKKGISFWDDPTWSPEGLGIHCEYGDCTAVDYNKVSGENQKPRTLRVITPDGSRASVPLTACWVITRSTAKGEDIRQAFARMVGAIMNVVVPKVAAPKRVNPLDQEPDEQDQEGDSGRGVQNRRGRLAEKDPKGTKGGFELFVSSYDNYLALALDSANPNVEAALPKLKKLGFAPSLPYRSTPIKNYRVLANWLKAVDESGLVIADAYAGLLEKDLELLKQHKDLFKVLQGMGKSARPNFFREQMKPGKRGVIKPYLFIDNATQVYLCLNVKSNAPSMSAVMAVESTGITWSPVVKTELTAFFRNKNDMVSVIKKMLAQFDIENRREVIADSNRVRVAPMKVYK